MLFGVAWYGMVGYGMDMTKIKKVETVWLYCKKCKNMEEHRVYLKETGEEVKHCLRCRHERSFNYEVFGRQSPKLNLEKKDIQKDQQFGRLVA